MHIQQATLERIKRNTKRRYFLNKLLSLDNANVSIY